MTSSSRMTKVIKRGPAALGDVGAELAEPVKRAPIIRGDVVDARSEARDVRERAEADAAATRQRALEEAEAIKERARLEGYRQGRDEGAAELVELVTRASRRLERIDRQALPQLRDLALAIARKVLGRELQSHPEAVVDVVRQALADKARQRREIVVRVSPEDLAVVRERKPEILEVLTRAKEIVLREDPNVARHGAVIETEAGVIDAQLETQLAAVERAMKETR